MVWNLVLESIQEISDVHASDGRLRIRQHRLCKQRSLAYLVRPGIGVSSGTCGLVSSHCSRA
jgi:hypothetical protein